MTIAEQRLSDFQCPMLNRDGTMVESSPNIKVTHKQWWLLVTLCILFVFVGQTGTVLLGRYYYAGTGSSTFVGTLIQSAAFPILYIPLILIPSDLHSSSISKPVAKKYIALIYIGLGVLLTAVNFLQSVGLLYLSASTYSLISATQLAFNGVFSYFLNSQKFTALIMNSVIALTISAVLLAVGDSSDQLEGVSKAEYVIGVLCTVSGSAANALLFSLMQLTFDKVIKAETFAMVIEMQIYVSLVASVLPMGGLFGSGQWKTLGSEMENFDSGPASYVMTLVWTAILSQIGFLGVVGSIFLISSLFSNVISTSTLAATPIASLVVFHDPMSSVKGLAMLLSLWGFVTYLFQNYLDHRAESPLEIQTYMPIDDFEIQRLSTCVV